MNIGNKLSAVSTVVTSKAGRTLLKGQKHSPAILFAAGVVGFGATIVMASKATLQLETVLTQNERKQGEAHDLREIAKIKPETDYSEKDYNRDLKILKLRFIKDITKLYAPAAIVGIASVAALTGSHVILTNRNTGLMAAYAAIDKSYSEYRKRVVDEFGEDKDRELRFGVEEVELAVDDPETGRTTVENVKLPSGVSDYARIWSSQTSDSWDPNPDYNLVTLQARQSYANDMLRIKGHVLLNDVYDSLGLSRTKAGCVVGWVKDGKHDNFIDFGIFSQPDKFVDFMSGREGALWLDFNVDGIVYDLI